MDAMLTLELTDAQRELLVEGLRFVRSARKLSVRDKFTNHYPNSADELNEVSQLMDRLGGRPKSKVEVAQ